MVLLSTQRQVGTPRKAESRDEGDGKWKAGEGLEMTILRNQGAIDEIPLFDQADRE